MDDGNRPVNTTSAPRSTPDDAIDRAVREALDVSPSADFVARVRTRIANEPAPSGAFGGWMAWTPIAACATAAAIALAVWIGQPASVPLRSDQTVRLKPDTTPDTTATPTVRLEPETTPDTTATPTVRLKPDSTSDQGTSDPRPYVVSAFRRTVVASHKEPEILISREESAALRRLIARASDGQIAAQFSTPATEPDMDVPPLPEIKPLKIEPVVPVNGEEGVRQ